MWWVVTWARWRALAVAAFAGPRARAWALVLALASLLAVPAWASVRAIEHHTSDTNQLGLLPPAQLRPLSTYLRAHQGSARYEAAYDSATKMGALVVHDAAAAGGAQHDQLEVVTPLSRLQARQPRGPCATRCLSAPCSPHSRAEPRLLDGRALDRGPRHERQRPGAGWAAG